MKGNRRQTTLVLNTIDSFNLRGNKVISHHGGSCEERSPLLLSLSCFTGMMWPWGALTIDIDIHCVCVCLCSRVFVSGLVVETSWCHWKRPLMMPAEHLLYWSIWWQEWDGTTRGTRITTVSFLFVCVRLVSKVIRCKSTEAADLLFEDSIMK